MSGNPLDKLNAKADKTTTSILNALKRAQDAVKLEILKAAEEGKINTNAQEREKLFARIAGEYAALGGDMTKAMGGLVDTAGKDATKHTAQTTGVDVPFDKTRLNAVWSYLAPTNTQNLSAVFTDQMSENAIKKLRGAFLDTYRQAQVEGWTANETSKKMRDSWDAVAHDENTYRFVDKSGKAWENARYLQMLHRTTAMRVERDYTIDRMAEAGITLYRIVGPSEECHICDAWQGQIIQMSRPQKGGRRLPTYADALAAGMFHPNCVHYLEPMDEDWGDDAGEIARQEREKVPATMSPEAMQGRKDAIDKSRKIEVDGMTPEEAALSVTRDRIVDAVRIGLFDRDLSLAVANGLSDADIGRIQASGIPKFRKVKKEESIGWRKGERGGVLRVPRDATADQVLALLAPKTSPKTAPKPAQPPVPSKPNAVRVARDSIVNSKTEIFVVLNADGTERFPRHESGVSGGYLPTEWAGNSLVGATFIHNHPSGLDKKRKGFGTSFSPEDVKTASVKKLAEMRAVSPRRDYWIKPGANGWPNTQTIKAAYDRQRWIVKARLDGQVYRRRITPDQASALLAHIIWKSVAKETGMVYGFDRIGKSNGV